MTSAVDHSQTYEYSSEIIWCQRDTNRIFGVAYIPNVVDAKLPLVIFSHGLNGNYHRGGSFARLLAEHGYMVYRFDFCGGPNSNRSDGSTTEMSIRTQEADLKAVIDHLSSDVRVDADRIYLLGSSQGGMVSAMTAADHPQQVRAALLIYPAFCIHDEILTRFPSRDSIPDTFIHHGVSVGRIYATDAYDYDIYTELPKFTKDVLIIHGTADNDAPISYSERMVELYASAELKRMEGVGHRIDEGYVLLTSQWILDFLMAEEIGNNIGDGLVTELKKE